MKNFKVDEKVVWTSPYMSKEQEVSYRGEYQGQAIIWTGTLQFAVPLDQIRKKVGK
jgi:hypothetical protein